MSDFGGQVRAGEPVAEENGGELGPLLRLAFPLALVQAGNQLMSFVDTAVVGRMGAIELGGVGIANGVFFAFAVFGIGIMMGLDPLTSQAIGARDPCRAREMVWQGIWLAVLAGALLAIPIVLALPILEAFGIAAPIVSVARVYLLVRLPGIIPMLVFVGLRAYLQAVGLTRPMVTAMVVANVFNLIGDVVLVFGGAALPEWAGPLRAIPAMGVAGAAIATVASMLVQVVMLGAAIRRFPLPAGVIVSRRPDKARILQAFRVGLPVGSHYALEVGVFALVGLFAGRLGEIDLAAHQIVLTLASFTFTVAVGIGASGSVRVGHAVGARDTPRARRAGLVAFAAGGGLMSLTALGFWLAPATIAGILTNQASVIAAAVPLLGVAAVFQIFDGLQGSGAGVLRGAGDTNFAFWANLAGHWVIGLPIALLLGFHYQQGIVGLWWGLCAGLMSVAIILLARFLWLSSRPIEPLGAVGAG